MHGVRTVYLDDFASGTIVYGNIFYQAGRAAFIGGGRDNLVENNIFVECDPSIQVDGCGLSWATHCFDKSHPFYTNVMFDRMNAVNYCQPPYSEKYPELLSLHDDEPRVPKNNKIVRNVSYGGRFIDLYDKLDFNTVFVEANVIADSVIFKGSKESEQSDNFQMYEYGHAPTMEKMKGNKFVKGNPGFQNVRNEDFQLKRNSPAFELGFKEMPIEKIGLYIDKYRKSIKK